MSVFVGGFGLDEARGVAGESDEVIEALEQLVVKSLVAVDTSGQSPRFRLLDTTRAYAGAKLREAGMAGEVSRRHARHYLDWLTRSTNCAAVPLEHASNIRAALEWALSDHGDPQIGVGLATYACELFLRLGMVTESRRWSERALESLSPGAPVHCRTWPCARRWGLTDWPEVPTRCALHSNERCSWRKGSTTRSIVSAAQRLYVFHRRAGALDGLLPIAECAATIAPLLGGTAPTVAAQAMLGVAHHLRGNLAESHALLAAVRDTHPDASATENFYGFHRDAEVMIARTQWLQGFPDKAALTAANANRFDERRDPVTTCLGLMWGVSVYHLRGDWSTTEEYVERMLTLASEHALLPYKWFAMALRGDLQLRRGDTVAGIGNLNEYSRRLVDGGYDIGARWLACCLAKGWSKPASRAGLQRLSESTRDRLRGPMPTCRSSFACAARPAEAGDSAAAEHAFRISMDMADAQGALSWRLRTATSVAHLRLRQRRFQEAYDALAPTYERFTEGFETLDLRIARALIAEIDARTGARTPT